MIPGLYHPYQPMVLVIKAATVFGGARGLAACCTAIVSVQAGSVRFLKNIIVGGIVHYSVRPTDRDAEHYGIYLADTEVSKEVAVAKASRKLKSPPGTADYEDYVNPEVSTLHGSRRIRRRGHHCVS